MSCSSSSQMDVMMNSGWHLIHFRVYFCFYLSHHRNKALMCRNLVKQTLVETKDLISASAHDSIKSLCFDSHICSAPLPPLMCSIFVNNAASLYRITISVLVKMGTMLPLAFNYRTVQQAQCFFSALQQGHKKKKKKKKRKWNRKRRKVQHGLLTTL